MNKQVTFGHILSFLAIIIIPLLIWGVNLEVRDSRQDKDIFNNKEDITEIKEDTRIMVELIQMNHNETMKGLHNIELQLKDKKDRE
jgi:hypothetical protein